MYPALLWCLLFLGLHPLLRAVEPVEGAFTATADGSSQLYAELLPPGFDPAVAHDLVIALHGHGSDRWQFIRDGRDECRAFRDTAAKHNLILLSPDYRAKTSWMGPLAEADMVQLIGEFQKRYKIHRVILAGASMGGTGALTFAALHPELVSAVCSLNGTANLLEYERFQDAISASFGGSKAAKPGEYRKRSAEFWPERFLMPVAVGTGGRDQIVPPESVLRLAERLSSFGTPLLCLHREQGGHSTNYADACAALEFAILEARKPGVETRLLEAGLERVRKRLRAQGLETEDSAAQWGADALIFVKAVEWALRYDAAPGPADFAQLKRALTRAWDRADALAEGRTPWASKRGRVVRAFLSAVDGSVQPYGVVLPAAYDGTRPMRLDVVLHGSSKPVGMSETRFISRFDEGDGEGVGPAADFIEVHPLGRVENGYRWAGETDVFEAIEAVASAYAVDRNRIVLRGMSMGASGTWHLGLKHPSRFAALGPYCGYVDTHRFSETPLPNFIRVGALPAHQEMGLHMLDSVDYAANASMVPAVGAIGDKDVFFQSHVHMREAFQHEGLEMVNLISKGTGHVQDPATFKEQMRLISAHVDAGLQQDPLTIRFVTWTLKYSRCHWLEVAGLLKHYERAEIRAERDAADFLKVSMARNISRFAVHRTVRGVRIEGIPVALPEPSSPDPLLFTRTSEGWNCVRLSGAAPLHTLPGKRPGLQGPMDDAFTAPFLCVRGTGTPWNPRVHAWAMASLKRFEYEWARYMRGDLPLKEDSAVTAEDLQTKHLVLFGDPGSNSLLAKVLPKLPLQWTASSLQMGRTPLPDPLSAKEHVPVLIAPNPLAPARYVVVNSGHSFREKEFASLNYLLFPRLGDCAILRLDAQTGEEAGAPPSPPAAVDPRNGPAVGSVYPRMRPPPPEVTEHVVRVGYFSEDWQTPVWTAP